MAPDPLFGRGQIVGQLVAAHGEEHMPRAAGEAGQPVAHQVQADQLPFFGDALAPVKNRSAGRACRQRSRRSGQ